MAKHRLVLEKVLNTDSETVPKPRSGHRCATDGVFLYSFGGFNPNTHGKLFHRNIWCFHLSSKKWYNILTEGYRCGKMPTCVASSTMVLHKGRFIVFGGSGYPFGSSNSNRTFECDPREQRWHYFSVTSEDVLPTPGYGQGVVMSLDDCMFIFGGTRGLVYNNHLHKFDLKTHRWEFIECNRPPSARYRHEMVAIEGGFIVIGGYGHNGACPLDKLPFYSYANCSWKEVSCEEDPDHGFPKARRAHSCVKFKDNVYVSGGLDKESTETIYDDIWMLNVKTFSWLKISQTLPRPTFFHSAAVTSEGCMYIFGGVEWIAEDEGERTNNVLKMWLVVPSLETLCWEALCDTIPPDGRLDTSKLGSLCVPKYLLAGYDAQFCVGRQNDDM